MNNTKPSDAIEDLRILVVIKIPIYTQGRYAAHWCKDILYYSTVI